MLHGKVVIAGIEIEVEIAVTESEHEQGLAGRDILEFYHGMLFALGEADYYVIWTKDMKFFLDIVWIHNDRIVDIDESVPPDTSDNPEKYTSAAEANYALEVRAGTVEKFGWKIGDSVDKVLL